MRIILNIFLFLVYNSLVSAGSFQDRAKSISTLIPHFPDSAYNLALALKSDSEKSGNDFGLVRSNFILGYLQWSKGNFGKSIIYYLEAIRFGENSNHDGVQLDLASIHKNCGAIFRKFKAYDLALEYYQKGLDYAIISNFKSEIVGISYNLSSVYYDMNKFEKAISILERLSKNLSTDDKRYFNVNNRLGLVYLKAGYLDDAANISIKVLNTSDQSNPKLIDTYQILGRVYSIRKMYSTADENFNQALSIAINNDLTGLSQKSFFETYRDLGNNKLIQGKLRKSEAFYKKAEKFVPQLVQKPEYFELYKTQANLYYELGDYKKSKHYEDLYSNSLNEYLNVQAEIQETDKRYNMDLITKRYFAEVDKQERIADILMYSKLTSGGLLTLLLLVIGYHRYQKIRLRKSIERELIALNIVE